LREITYRVLLIKKNSTHFKTNSKALTDLTQQINFMKKQIFQIEEAEQLKSEQLESTKSENMMIRSKLLELEEFLRDVEQERDRYRSYVTNRI